MRNIVVVTVVSLIAFFVLPKLADRIEKSHEMGFVLIDDAKKKRWARVLRKVAQGEAIVVALDEEDPRIHIGKSYGVGSRQVGFTWAQHITIVLRACWDRPKSKIVRDEYGKEYTGDEFRLIIKSVHSHARAIGTRFN